MKRQTLPLPPPHKAPPRVERYLRPPSDPAAFTALARSLAFAPLQAVVGMSPADPKVLFPMNPARLNAPHDHFHLPSGALVRSTFARERLQRLFDDWCTRPEVKCHPGARSSMEMLEKLLARSPAEGMPVQLIQTALNTLSAALDPDCPWGPGTLPPGVPAQPVAPAGSRGAGASPMPDLPGLVSAYLGTDDPTVRPNLRAVASQMQDALAQPGGEIDLGWLDAEDVKEFDGAGGMAAWLKARATREPPLEVVTLCPELEELPGFLEEIPTLQELVVPHYQGNRLDLSRLPALDSVCLSGEVPVLHHVQMPEGRQVRIEDADGNPIALAPPPADPTDP